MTSRAIARQQIPAEGSSLSCSAQLNCQSHCQGVARLGGGGGQKYIWMSAMEEISINSCFNSLSRCNSWLWKYVHCFLLSAGENNTGDSSALCLFSVLAPFSCQCWLLLESGCWDIQVSVTLKLFMYYELAVILIAVQQTHSESLAVILKVRSCSKHCLFGRQMPCLNLAQILVVFSSHLARDSLCSGLIRVSSGIRWAITSTSSRWFVVRC